MTQMRQTEQILRKACSVAVSASSAFPWIAPLLLAAAACGPMGDGAAGGGRSSELRGALLTPARAKPDFTLTTTGRQPYRFRAETDGDVALVFFGYTHCPDICPLHMANIAAALRTLTFQERQRVRVIFVTTDPERDTPERTRTWLDNFDASFVGLHGPMDEVNALQISLGMPPAAREQPLPGAPDSVYGVAHGAAVLAFTPDDSLRALYGFGTRQADWANDLPRLLRFTGGPRRLGVARPAPPASIVVANLVAPAPVIVGSPADAAMSVYFTITNRGGSADTLMQVLTSAARAASVHETMQHDLRATMHAAPYLAVRAGETMRLAPGGTHVMLEGLTSRFAPGDTIALGLVFRRAGRVNVAARVVAYDQLDRELAR